MKRVYENFTELAEHFVTGESWTHICSEHTSDECFAWQHGVKEFAHWLDEAGVKIIENPEIYNKLWDSLGTFKPDNFTVCPRLI